jgi:hypothetical protein
LEFQGAIEIMREQNTLKVTATRKRRKVFEESCMPGIARRERCLNGFGDIEERGRLRGIVAGAVCRLK